MADQPDEEPDLLWEIVGPKQEHRRTREKMPGAAARLGRGLSVTKTANELGLCPRVVKRWALSTPFRAWVRKAQEWWFKHAMEKELKRMLLEGDEPEQPAGSSGRKRHENQEPMTLGHKVKSA